MSFFKVLSDNQFSRESGENALLYAQANRMLEQNIQPVATR
jgi:hypothetical protein